MHEVSVFSVLYLFAGRKRRSDLGSYLKKFSKDHNIKVKIEEIDILRGKRHDLTRSKRKHSILARVG